MVSYRRCRDAASWTNPARWPARRPNDEAPAPPPGVRPTAGGCCGPAGRPPCARECGAHGTLGWERAARRRRGGGATPLRRALNLGSGEAGPGGGGRAPWSEGTRGGRSWLGGVPRSQRLCPLFQSQYCDERHALLECPALVSLRDKYNQLFCVHNSMRQFLWQNNMLLLVRYVIKCLDSFAATQ